MIGRRAVPVLCAVALLQATAGCGRAPRVTVQDLESIEQDVRTWKDAIDVTRARGAGRSLQGVPLGDLVARYGAARLQLKNALSAGRFGALSSDDRRALDAIRRAFDKDFGEEKEAPAGSKDTAETPACSYDPLQVSSGPNGMKDLTDRMYACFGRAAHELPFEGKTLDRLTVFGLLPVTDDAARRRSLFLAFGPVWTSINGDDGPRTSPYRQLVRLSAAQRRAAGGTSIEAAAVDLGIEPGLVESWLTSVLEAWHAATPDEVIEPWDFAYRTGQANRALRAAIPLASLRQVNDRFYRDLGADVTALGIHYDLEPRESKDPVAFTTFGARPRLAGGAWAPGEPWVFASYSIGGIDNLNELLHESGHAVHIAAIRTRPAFMDWPDSDLFTEAIADVAALEMFEPEWQRRYLGVSVPLRDSLRAKYSGIVMDTAWALFEIRMHREPGADPNRVWTDITGRYFRVRPHPELSWWALRGQLVNLPGYMLNYAIGAILVADLRARVKELHGPYAEGDPTWYAWMSEKVYRFGLERPSRRVIEDFLGRPVSPRALLDDLARARPAS